jgi:dihydropteroate synthase
MTLPLLMGIINVTPDSFSDGGAFADATAAIRHGRQLMDEGAAILDIGGESTRPGAAVIAPEEEQRRILPVIAGLRDEAAKRGVALSLDSRNAATMRAGLKVGVNCLNDISALTHDPESLRVAAQSDARIILMHMQGTPQTMQKNPYYKDVVEDVFAYLQNRITDCMNAGIARERLIADPGLGFGKTAEHSVALLKNLSRFRALGVPLLIGASRKSFITAMAGTAEPRRRLGGSLAAALYAANMGAHILRVHDVAEHRQALMINAILKADPS